MYGGRIMEFGDTKTILNNPVHPYTIKLIESFRRAKNNRMTTIPGSVKPLVDELKGCPFAPRCEFVFDRCHVENPVLTNADDDHQVACWWNLDSERPR